MKINPGVQQTWLGGTPQGARLGVALLPTNSQPMMMVMTMIFPVKWQPPVPKQSQFQIFDEKMSSFSSFFLLEGTNIVAFVLVNVFSTKACLLSDIELTTMYVPY